MKFTERDIKVAQDGWTIHIGPVGMKVRGDDVTVFVSATKFVVWQGTVNAFREAWL